MTALTRRAFVHAGAWAAAALALGIRSSGSPAPRPPVPATYLARSSGGTWGFVRVEAAAEGELVSVDGVLGIRALGRSSRSGVA